MLRILLVEDNPADAQMLRTALGKTGMPVNITHVLDGVEAVEYLAKHENASQCDVVVLDLNLRGSAASKSWNKSEAAMS
jgi:CheY-like chemotaxis protein